MSEQPYFYFIAIGGVGQSALAEILLSLGCKVEGSDIAESKYTKLLRDLGAKIYIGHDEKNIQGTPKVVVSSAIKDNNPELTKAKKLNLDIYHRSDCLKYISQHYPCFIGFSGTHGKTTTSGFMSFILKKINANPTSAIGGIIPEFNTNAFCDKNSKYFTAELDESDGSIVKYKPHMLVINNLEADHLDHYKNGLDDIILTFSQLLGNLSQDAKIFVNKDDQGVNKLLKEIKNKNIITYAIDQDAFYSAKNIRYKELCSSFDFYKKDQLIGNIELVIPAKYNVYNALAVLSVLDNLGFNYVDYSKHFKEFTGMGRRFQLVSDKNDVKIIDDYAHHPNEIKSALSAAKNLKNRKVAIFQPHRYTRLKGLWDEFLNSFFDIDKLFILDTFSAGDEFDKEFNSENFAQEISKKGLDAKYIQGSIKQAAQTIAPHIQKGDIVFTIGAGDITKIGREIDDLLTTGC